MRERVTPWRDAAVVGLGLAAMLAAPAAATADALPPKDIQATFFDGRRFTATTPSGVSFEMVFDADGTMRRKPVARDGSKGEGTWTLDADGFCTTWKGHKANCFRVLPAGPNAWAVMKGPTLKATWSK